MTKRYIFATISLHKMAGGLERNIVRIANRLADQGHRVELLTFDTEGADSYFPINESIHWHKVGKTTPHRNIGFFERAKLLWRMRVAIRPKQGEATQLIAFHHGILVRLLIASCLTSVRTICSERNSVSIYKHIQLGKWNRNFLMLYFCDLITVQFPAYINDYPRSLRARIKVIPNIVDPASLVANPSSPDKDGRFKILAAGRLCDQKNYSCLIRAFARLASRHSNWDLVILGNGESESQLKNLIHELGLTTRVSLPGTFEEMAPWYSGAHMFCMPSKWEGFPNALAEAMSYGLPCIGFRGCAGVRELLEQLNNGFLVAGNGDIDALESGLEVLIQNPERRLTVGREAREVIRRYSHEQVFPLWLELLSS